jgi:hypothetical protein
LKFCKIQGSFGTQDEGGVSSRFFSMNCRFKGSN